MADDSEQGAADSHLMASLATPVKPQQHTDAAAADTYTQRDHKTRGPEEPLYRSMNEFRDRSEL